MADALEALVMGEQRLRPRCGLRLGLLLVAQNVGGAQLRNAIGMLFFLAGALVSEALPANKTALILSQRINQEGPFLGLVVPMPFEKAAMLQEKLFTPHPYIPWLDLAGRRFHIGRIEGHKVIVVQSGGAMLNAGITTQQLLDLFDVNGIVHYGIAGSSNNSLNIGDITIPKYWAHTGLWNWQKYGSEMLSSGPSGHFSKELGSLKFGDYDIPKGYGDNLLSSVWLQEEEILTVEGSAEVGEKTFWVQVGNELFDVAKQLEGMELKSCFNATTCLNVKPKVIVGLRGASSNHFVGNVAYRDFLYSHFNVSSVDMESAAVALVCKSNNISFIGIRSISDMAGNSEGSNEVSIFKSLASLNAVKVLRELLKKLNTDHDHDHDVVNVDPQPY